MRCPKCKGYLVPERDISGLTQSIGCINCGNRVFRGLGVRQPTAAETRGNLGVSGHSRRLTHV